MAAPPATTASSPPSSTVCRTTSASWPITPGPSASHVADNPGDIAAPQYRAHRRTRGSDRGPCGFDVRHIFNTTLVASSHFASLHGWKGALANDWQVAPLIRISPARPSTSPPVRTIHAPESASTGRILSPASCLHRQQDPADAAPTLPTSTGRPSPRMLSEPTATSAATPSVLPTSITSILPSAASSPSTRDLNFQLRMEAFNVMNHPNFTVTSASGASAFTTTPKLRNLRQRHRSRRPPHLPARRQVQLLTHAV